MAVKDSDEVGEQVFLLRVLVRKLVQVLEQLDSGKTENAGVHFPDLPLGDRAQPVFDNGSHAAPVLPPLRSLGAEANDAAVASWIVKISAQHGSGGASLPVRLNQSAQRFRAQ